MSLAPAADNPPEVTPTHPEGQDVRRQTSHPHRGRRAGSSGRAQDRTRIETKVSVEFINRLVSEVTKGFRGDVGVVPRQFLRQFVTQLDLVDENDDYDPMTEYGFVPLELSAEEQYAITGSPKLIDDDDSLAVAEDTW